MKATTVADVRRILAGHPDTMPVTINTPVGDVPVQFLPIHSEQGDYLVVIEDCVGASGEHIGAFQGAVKG